MTIKVDDAVSMGLESHLELLQPPATVPTFEGVREYKTPVRHPVFQGNGVELLAMSQVQCQKGGRPKDASHCLQCSRFVNFVPSTDRSQITIRCFWSGQDPVTDLMTREPALVTVSPQCSCVTAHAIAEHNHVRHLLVVHNEALVGVICRCQTLETGRNADPVSEWMSRRIGVVNSSATLAEAAATMAEHDVDMVVVIVPDTWNENTSQPRPTRFIIGALTRGDLRRCGVEDAMVSATACAYCGSCQSVCRHPQAEAVHSCLNCLEDAMNPIPFEELGSGD